MNICPHCAIEDYSKTSKTRRKDMRTSSKSIFIALILTLASLIPLWAIDINQLKYESGILTIEGNKLQSIEIYSGGNPLVFPKAPDVSAVSIVADALTIVTKDRSITISISNIKAIILSPKQSVLGIHI
jgi:hypothetical protein